MSDLFFPTAENGLAARRRIQARLAVSIAHILEQCRGIIPFDEKAGEALVDLLNSPRRVRPAVFGHYTAAVRAIMSLEEEARPEDEAAARDALGRMVDGPIEAEEGIEVRPLARPFFTEAEEATLRDQFVSESLPNELISALDEETAGERVECTRNALDLVRKHAPASFSEMRHVIAEIVLAGDPGTGDAQDFAACSSIERWGAMLINPGAMASALELADALIHEEAHSYLYGASPVEFHVRNPIGERYKSPLRKDPRPMDGIYHATFVLARTCFSMNEFAASEGLDSTVRSEARQRANENLRLFHQGYAVLEEHADYTDEGRAIMSAAHRYMASLGSPVSA